MLGACICIRASIFKAQGIELAMDATALKPLKKDALFELLK